MNTTRHLSIIALFLAAALALTLGTPRAARADDDGAKIVGGILAGAILYELLDDDDDGCRPPRPRYRHHEPYRYGYDYRPRTQRRYRRPDYYDGYRYRCDDDRYRGYRPPPRYRSDRYGAYRHGSSGVHLDVHRGRHGGTSVGFGFRGR